MRKILVLTVILGLLVCGTAYAGGTKNVNVNDNNSQAQSDSAAMIGVAEFSPRQYLQPQAIYPYLLQMVPGVIGDVTDREEMPSFAAVLPLAKTDKVLKVIYYTRGGRIAGFSRLEDFDSDLIDLIPTAIEKFGQKDTTKIRFKVLFKMSTKTIGSGGGGGGSLAGIGGGGNPLGYGANASILPGVAINTSDPKFCIKFFLIQ